MTPAEYLEFVQEKLAFPDSGRGQDPSWLLYVTEYQCRRLHEAHTAYCASVADILHIQLPEPWEQSGGPEDRPDHPPDNEPGRKTTLHLVPDSDGGTPD